MARLSPLPRPLHPPRQAVTILHLHSSPDQVSVLVQEPFPLRHHWEESTPAQYRDLTATSLTSSRDVPCALQYWLASITERPTSVRAIQDRANLAQVLDP